MTAPTTPGPESEPRAELAQGQTQTPADSGPGWHIIEARCLKCGQTYNPHSFEPDDLEHWSREDGTECGGQPDPASLGTWSA